MAHNKDFCCNYMVLEPNEVGLFDLFHILFSRNIEKRKFVFAPEGTEESFQHRWIIFISILAQKFLQSVAKPLKRTGTMLELWLNLPTCNHGFLGLLLNFLRGKVVFPDKTSSTFLSTIGNFDKRVELDGSIKHGDSKYTAALSMMASKAAYENNACIKTMVTDHWKMEFLGSYDFWNDYQEKFTTQAFMLHDKTTNVAVVAFRGTEPFDADAWCTDIDISWYELPNVGKIHGGFMKALGLQKDKGWPKEIEQAQNKPIAYYFIREKLREVLRENDSTKFLVTGHSLGGALAILFPAVLILHEEEWIMERLEGVYTFGQPRVGDEKFAEFMKEKLMEFGVRYYRFVYNNDMVPRLPYDDSVMLFKHFGTCLFYNSFYEGQVVAEEPNKNYFSPLTAIPKTLNAMWELIRSFIIPYTDGPSYTESYFLRVFRIIGLLIPGIPAHCPQDYVNATRLGSPDVFVKENSLIN